LRLLWLGAALLLAGLLAGLDVATKGWAEAELGRGGSRALLGGHLVLRLQQNSGIAFGMFRAHLHPHKVQYLVAYKSVVAGGVGALLAWHMLRRKAPGRLVPLGLTLLLGGTVGNLLDRAQTRAVTDFIDVRLGGWRWPAFNLADVFLALGVVLCAVGLVAAIRRGGDEGADRPEAG
jgi:signal peptidase II